MGAIGLVAMVLFGGCTSDSDGSATRKKASSSGSGGESVGGGGGGPTACEAMCAHVYGDCQTSFQDANGVPLDESGCVDSCSNGALTSDQVACFTTAACGDALVACATAPCSSNCGACDNLADGICPSAACVQDPDCAACTPSCDGRTCGPDGCGGECGQCSLSQTCNAAGQCETPSNGCSLGLGSSCVSNSSVSSECCTSGLQCWLYQGGYTLCCSNAQSPCPSGDADCCPGLACGTDGLCH